MFTRFPTQKSSKPRQSFESRFQKITSSPASSNLPSTFSPKPENFSATHDYIESLIEHAQKSLELCLCNAGLSSLTVPNPIHKQLSSTLLVTDLSKNNLQEVPHLIRDCYILDRLYLKNNRLKSTPSEHYLFLAESLTVLDVSSNLLENIELDSLIFHNLQKLDVSNNKITALPDLQLCFPKLLQLLASNNRLSKISSELPIDIVHLDVNSNKLTSIDNVNFSDLAKLNHLDLRFNSIKYLPKSLYFIRQNLKILKLEWNRLEVLYAGRGLRHVLSKDQVFADEDRLENERIQTQKLKTQFEAQKQEMERDFCQETEKLRFEIEKLAVDHEKQSSTVSTASETAKIDVFEVSTMTEPERNPKMSNSNTFVVKKTVTNPEMRVSESKSFNSSPNRRRREAVDNYKKVVSIEGKSIEVGEGTKSRLKSKDRIITRTNKSVDELRDFMTNFVKLEVDPNLIKTDAELSQFLSDGVYLCQLVNKLAPNSISPIHVKLHNQRELNVMKKRSNVNNFIKFYLDIKGQTSSVGHQISTKPVCSASFILEKRSLASVSQFVMILVDFLTNYKSKKKRSASTAQTIRKTTLTSSSNSSTPRTKPSEDSPSGSNSSRSSSSPRSNKLGNKIGFV